VTTLISIGSGKGGVGKSVLSSNIAVILAAKGFKVTLVDLDAGGADCHILLGHFRPKHTLADFMLRRVESLQDTALELSEFNNLRLIPGMGESMFTASLPTGSRQKLIRHIKKLDADFVIIDVGAGTSFDTLDYFMMADFNICITTAEPTAVLDLYRFVKLGVIRKALSVFLARDEIRKTITKTNIQSVDEIFALAEKADEGKKASSVAAVKGFKPLLVFNRVEPKKKNMYLLQLQKLLRTYVGVDNFPLLGEIPSDPNVEQSVSEYLPIALYASESPAAKAMEKIALDLINKAKMLG